MYIYINTTRPMLTGKNEKTLNFMKFYKYIFYPFKISGIFTSPKTNTGTEKINARYVLVKMCYIILNIISTLSILTHLSYILQPSSKVISVCIRITYYYHCYTFIILSLTYYTFLFAFV